MTREVGKELCETTEHKEYIIDELLDEVKDDKLVLPSFQRGFVWTLQKIIALFDSIMLGFPISTFIFWELEEVALSESWFYPFFKELTFRFGGKVEKEPADQPIGTKDKTVAVLDGQQRLTGLYAALRGTVLRAPRNMALENAVPVELYLDLGSETRFSDDNLLGEDSKENVDDENERDPKTSFLTSFKFRWDTKNPGKNWFKVKDVYVLKDLKSNVDRKGKMKELLKDVDTAIRPTAEKNLETLRSRLFEEKYINGSILKQWGPKKALEIFIRFNSGGTKLDKADLVFSAIEEQWPEGKNKVEQYLKKLNKGGTYSFDRMFLARLVLVLFGEGKDVRTTNISNKIIVELKDKENWTNIQNAIDNTCRFLKKEVGITGDRTLSSYTSIIPIIYSVYYNNGEVKYKWDIKKYIYRALMLNIFSRSSSTDLLLKLIDSVKDKGGLKINDIEKKIPAFKVKDEDIDNIVEREKSLTTELILRLIGNSSGSSEIGDGYHQDHIHASALFKSNTQKGVIPKDWAEWRKKKDKLPNLGLLKEWANWSKGAKRLDELTKAQQSAIRGELGLSKTFNLALENFGEFYERRKVILKKKLKEMLG